MLIAASTSSATSERTACFEVRRYEILLGQVGTHSNERILGLPFSLLVARAVHRLPVVRGVCRVPVHDGLYEGRSAAGSRLLHGFGQCFMNREGVHAVDAHSLEPVGDRLLGDGLRAGLASQRRRLRVLVVLAVEDNGSVPHAREVHAGVEVTLRRGPVAEDCECDGILLEIAHRVREAGGVGDVAADGGVERSDAALERIPGQINGVEEDRELLVDGNTARQPDRLFAIRRDNPVLRFEHESGGSRSFLARRLVVGGNTAGSLQEQHTLVELARRDHGPIHVKELRIVELRGVADQGSLFVEGPLHSGPLSDFVCYFSIIEQNFFCPV